LTFRTERLVSFLMGFCPVPHTSRDQIWLGVGALLGAGIVYLTGRPASEHPKHVSPLAHGPVRVCVEFNDVRTPPSLFRWPSVTRGALCGFLQVADPDKFKLLYKDLVISSRTKDKGCVQYDLLQSTKDPVCPVPAPLLSALFPRSPTQTRRHAAPPHGSRASSLRTSCVCKLLTRAVQLCVIRRSNSE
jgi:hypothetical protein